MGHGAVASDACEVVEIAGPGHPGNGEEQKIGLGLAHGTDRHLVLGPVDRVSGLKAHHPLPSELAVSGADFRRCEAKLFEVRMNGRAQHLKLSPT